MELLIEMQLIRGRNGLERPLLTICRGHIVTAVALPQQSESSEFRMSLHGGLAQLGERLPCKQEVTGSIPVLSTIKEID